MKSLPSTSPPPPQHQNPLPPPIQQQYPQNQQPYSAAAYRPAPGPPQSQSVLKKSITKTHNNSGYLLFHLQECSNNPMHLDHLDNTLNNNDTTVLHPRNPLLTTLPSLNPPTALHLHLPQVHTTTTGQRNLKGPSLLSHPLLRRRHAQITLEDRIIYARVWRMRKRWGLLGKMVMVGRRGLKGRV
ncbi:hypothetical protein BC829DRAFT_381847, partial [Chytridium lagenaria]